MKEILLTNPAKIDDSPLIDRRKKSVMTNN